MSNSAFNLGSGGSGGGSGVSDAVTQNINQTSHSFSVGDIVRESGSIFNKAVASGISEAEVYGIVTTVSDVNNFTLTTHGNVSGLTSLTPGSVYFLSDVFSGSFQQNPPISPGTVVKPVLIAKTTTTGLFNIYNGYIPLSSSNVTTKTVSFSPSQSYQLFVCSGSNIVVDLYTASLFGNRDIHIKNVSSSLVTITSSLNQLIDGSSQTLYQFESIHLQCDGNSYYII